MAKCKSCAHFDVCERYDATVDFDVDDGVCRYYEKQLLRCKDCKRWTTHDNCYGECIHRHWIIEGEANAVTSHNDFCSYGERKDNG